MAAILAFVVSLVAGATAVSAEGSRKSSQAPKQWTRIRPLEQRSARAIRAGYEQSPTFRQLVDEIERSDLVVYVISDAFRVHSSEGFLAFMSKSAGIRYATAWIDPLNDDFELTALIGHELQHAAELARAPEVDTRHAFAAFYRALGHVSGTRQYETARAEEATVRILRELHESNLTANLTRSGG